MQLKYSSHIALNWSSIGKIDIIICLHRVPIIVTLVSSSYLFMFHLIIIITGFGVMTIFVVWDLTRHPKIENTPPI